MAAPPRLSRIERQLTRCLSVLASGLSPDLPPSTRPGEAIRRLLVERALLRVAVARGLLPADCIVELSGRDLLARWGAAREALVALRPELGQLWVSTPASIDISDESLRAAFLIIDALPPEVSLPGQLLERLLGWTIEQVDGRWLALPDGARRHAGAHYTPPALARRVVDAACDGRDEAAGGFSVCDPAMGAGALLAALLARWQETEGRTEAVTRRALQALHGVDRSSEAVALAQLTLWLQAGDPQLPADAFASRLVVGDALTGADFASDPEASAGDGLDWCAAFPHVAAAGGFACVVGNPPWVSYAGRAAQPLAPALRQVYAQRYESFVGYRNLQGLFVERSAALLQPGGRLALLLPASMSELEGYAPVRAALDRRAVVEGSLEELPEGAFEGVFQPSLVLSATARTEPQRAGSSAPWPMGRPELDALAQSILSSMSGPPLPPSLFSDGGVQTIRADRDHVREVRPSPGWKAVRAGGDLRPFACGAPSLWLDAAHFGQRLDMDADLLVRQTARVPMAAIGDGRPFRNSLLAVHASEAFPEAMLLAWLNSSPIRWLHYHRHRDARAGMPQLKISHLRSIPAPPPATDRAALMALGRALGRRNSGISDAEQQQLDALVADAFGLEAAQRARIAADAVLWALGPSRRTRATGTAGSA